MTTLMKLDPYEPDSIVCGHALDVLRRIPDGVFDCCVTSPPYWNLRDYQIAPIIWGGDDPECEHEWDHQSYQRRSNDSNPSEKQKSSPGSIGRDRPIAHAFCRKCSAWLGSLGLEPTIDLYISHLVEIFREVRRTLKDEATCWIVIGDSHCGYKGDNYGKTQGNLPSHCLSIHDTKSRIDTNTPQTSGLKPKDLAMIPARLALALQSDGWWLLSDIIWAKGRDGDQILYQTLGPGTSMPESQEGRPVSSHEHVLLLSKSARSFYDVDAVHVDWPGGSHRLRDVWFISPEPCNWDYCQACHTLFLGSERSRIQKFREDGKTNRRCSCGATDAWVDHFAAFSSKLVRICVKAGTSEKGCCPKCGKAWERIVEKTSHVNKREPAHVPNNTPSKTDSTGWKPTARATNHWKPTCSCDAPKGTRPDDFEIILTPIGERVSDDPTIYTGRAGMNRPRNDNEGTRPITRYEQRKYAEQLRNSPHRSEMEKETGSAFEHYIRTDRSGARPLPDEFLQRWLERGWIEQVYVPEWMPPDPVPAIVLDPFNGSGVTTLMAHRLARSYFGIDINSGYCEVARARLERAWGQPEEQLPLIEARPEQLEMF